MFGCLSSRGSGAMPTPNVPMVVPTMEEHKAAALQQLRALHSYEIDTKKKQTIATDLVRQGFGVNDPIEAIGSQEIRLLDLAFKEMDYDFAHFLVEHGANPRLCTEVAWFTDRMQELFDGLQTSIAEPDLEKGRQVVDNNVTSIKLPEMSSQIPTTSGIATSFDAICENIRNVSGRDVGRCLCSIATIFARLLAVGVGGVLYGGAVFVNAVTTLCIYLPFAVPVIVAWAVGRLIDALGGNKNLFVARLLSEVVFSPAIFIEIAMLQLRLVFVLGGAVGAGLMCVGLNPNDRSMAHFNKLILNPNDESMAHFKKLMSYAWYGFLGGFHKYGDEGPPKSMYRLCYEKIIGPLGPSLIATWCYAGASPISNEERERQNRGSGNCN